MIRPGRCLALLIAGASAAWSIGCGGGREVILRTAAGVEATAEEVDRQPLWLLPPGGVGWLHVEVGPSMSSELGRYLLAELRARFAMPESAGFVFERDVARLSVATYSMQGIDFAGVATGHFDAARFQAAVGPVSGGPVSGGPVSGGPVSGGPVSGGPVSGGPVSGGPGAASAGPALTRTEYAGRSLYMAGPVGFVVLTPQTALFGNETGIRRSLDRIAEARVADDLPAWVKELLASPNATFSAGVDLQANPFTAALSGRLSALRGAQMARALGNFDPPGINVAGTIGHADHEAARATAAALLQAGGSLNIYGRLFGLGQPIQKLETQAVGNDTMVVLAVDGGAVRVLIERFLPPPPAAPARTGQGSTGVPSLPHSRAEP